MRVYFDHQSATPVLAKVREAMLPFLGDRFGNPAALHQEAHLAREAVTSAREQVASFIHAEAPEDIIFTSNGTEAINLALKGTAWANVRRGKHIVATRAEQPAVMESLKFLEAQGFEITRLPVDHHGFVDIPALRESLREDTLLLCIHHANHDIGTIQEVAKVGEIAAERRVPLFVDAIASAGWLPVDVQAMKASLLAISPHRFGGPKGVGVLYRHRRARLTPLIHGGDQEGGRRAGMENIPAMVGAGVAAEFAARGLVERGAKARKLQELAWTGIQKSVPYVRLNGPPPGDQRLPNNLNISFEFIEGEGLALTLDVRGFAIASGAACVTKSLRVPPVLAAIGLDEDLAKGNVLITFGRENTPAEVESLLRILPESVGKLREMSPLWDDFRKGLIESRTTPRLQ